MRRSIALALLPLALAACTPGKPSPAKPPSPAAKVVGEPDSCIPIIQIRETRVRDDYTIDFIGNGGQVWRNTLPNRCPGLKSENAFTYETSLSKLCSTDIVYVLLNYDGAPHRGPGCGLGQFVPVELEEK